MTILQNEQLSLLKRKIDEMLDMLKTYDTHITARFGSTLQIISNNIAACMESDFDGIEELSRYVNEDWRSVCLSKSGIESWYFNVSDISLKERCNKEFETIALLVDKMLETNYLIPRKWYSHDELIRMGKKYNENENDWKLVIEKLQKDNHYYQSPMEEVPDDVWSFAKMLCLAGTDDSLQEWFLKDVPAFGYLPPIQILQLENGSNILRTLMRSIPI